jgi:hypothetical protein
VIREECASSRCQCELTGDLFGEDRDPSRCHEDVRGRRRQPSLGQELVDETSSCVLGGPAGAGGELLAAEFHQQRIAAHVVTSLR